jgi:two-component system, OmpR family, response regulator MprA
LENELVKSQAEESRAGDRGVSATYESAGPRAFAGQNGAVSILIVDDDRALRDALRRALLLAGYETETAAGGNDALARIRLSPPDAVILDIGMPDVDGLEVCRRLRSAGDRVPVLMLTARDAIEDRIDGLDAGADDYLVKPFDVGELQARLRALLRRAGGEDADATLEFGELRLDRQLHGVTVDGRFVELTRTEFGLLELLMRNPRQVLSHELIYERVWGYDFGPASNALRVYVGYLRRKLEQAGARPLIRNVRGVGYVLKEP